VPCKLLVCYSLLFAIDQTLNAHCQASQLYRYTNADICAIACFVSASVLFNQRMVDLALIKQVYGGLCSTKHKNCLAFYRQLEETCAYCATNAECKEAHKKSLATCLKVLLANCLALAVSTLATPIALKLVFINFKKIQGKDYVKIF
jgi:hypothetical protein